MGMTVVTDLVYRERAAPRCERNGMEEKRTEWSGEELGGALKLFG